MFLGINKDGGVTSQTVPHQKRGQVVARNERAVIVKWSKVWIGAGGRAGYYRPARTAVYEITHKVKNRGPVEVLRVTELIGYSHRRSAA